MTNPGNDAETRKQLIVLLEGGGAHIRFSDAIDDFPVERAGIRPEGLAHSAWELLEHLRIAQADILRFSSGEGYVELAWPKDYWPASPTPNEGEWDTALSALRKDLAEFVSMIKDERRGLLDPFPWADGANLLREALLIADHNSYHLGQLVLLKQLLG